MTRGSGDAASFKELKSSELAFLDGVRWGNGEWNAIFKPDKIRRMLKRAKKVGLESPAQILSDQLDAAKLTIWAFEKRQQRLLQGTASRALLTDAVEDKDEIVFDPTSDEGEFAIDEDLEMEDAELEAEENEESEEIVDDVDVDEDSSVYEL